MTMNLRDMVKANATMFATNRENAWNGIGTLVGEAKTSAEAIKLANLDWAVEPKPVMYNDEETGYFMNVRNDTDSVLGIVGSRYKVVQNSEAFDFMDELLGEGVTYESAGSMQGGKRIWLLAKMPEADILGDKVEPYMVFTNNHDGFGSVKVAMTPTRVVCQNTLTVALKNAKRTWNARHSGSIESKKADALATLNFAGAYMDNLKEFADKYATIKISGPEFNLFNEYLFPITEDMGARKEESQLMLRSQLESCYVEEDLGNIRNTAWGVINAVADMVSHKTPARMTDNYRENRFMSLVDGEDTMKKAQAIIADRYM